MIDVPQARDLGNCPVDRLRLGHLASLRTKSQVGRVGSKVADRLSVVDPAAQAWDSTDHHLEKECKRGNADNSSRSSIDQP